MPRGSSSSNKLTEEREPTVRLLCAGPDYDAAAPALSPHILLVVDQLPSNLGGGERVLLRLARLLPDYGYRVSILTLAADPESPALLQPPPCPIYMLPLQKTYGMDALWAARSLRRFIRRERIVLVQTFFESSDLWVGPLAKVLAGTKLIWSRRDMGILRAAKHRAAYRALAALPDVVFAVSEQVRQYSIEVDGVAPDRVETLYNGLDLGTWTTCNRAQNVSRSPVIRTVGNVRRVKGHDILIRAAASVARVHPRVCINIGGGILDREYHAELEALVENLHLEDVVSFEGPVTDLHSFLSNADIFVLPSRSEGFSNAIIEAMAVGLPVVATDVGGNAEAVKDRVTGRIVPNEDVDALADAILDLLAAPETASKMGQAGRERVADLFTTDAMMQRLVTTYKRLLGRPS